MKNDYVKECPFCNIIQGKLSAKKVYEDDKVFAFRDINPQAPTHILVVPKKHIRSLDELTKEDNSLIGHIFLVCSQIARENGLADFGYRIVANCGTGAGQSVFHIHFHLLGGRRMTWPPG